MIRRFLRWPTAAIALTMLGAAPTVFAQTPAPTSPAPAAPTPPPPPPPQSAFPAAPPKLVPGPPGIAAIVNGQKITKTEVKDQAYQMAGSQALQEILITTLVDQEAKKQNITVTPAEVNGRVSEARQQFSQQGRSLDDLLAQSGRTMAQFKENLRVRLEAEKLVTKTLPSVKMVHVRHILVATKNPRNDPSIKPHTDAEALAIIAKAQAELKAGKSFADVAKEYSEDTGTKNNGGDIGIVATGAPYDPNFLKASLALKKGEVTPTPVESVYGYHLIKADSTNSDATGAEKIAYASAEKAIRQQELAQALPAYVQNLRSKAKVTLYQLP